MELRVGGKYRLGRKIGSGSFGDIYLGKRLNIFTMRAFLQCVHFCEGLCVCSHGVCRMDRWKYVLCGGKYRNVSIGVEVM